MLVNVFLNGCSVKQYVYLCSGRRESNDSSFLNLRICLHTLQTKIWGKPLAFRLPAGFLLLCCFCAELPLPPLQSVENQKPTWHDARLWLLVRWEGAASIMTPYVLHGSVTRKMPGRSCKVVLHLYLALEKYHCNVVAGFGAEHWRR